MAKQTIDIGTSPGAGDGDLLRDAFDKTNDNFDELYATDLTKANSGPVTSSGLTATSGRLLGRTTTGTGAIEEMTASAAKTFLSLNLVDNTSDAIKPISTATQTALDGKEATIVAGTTGQYYRGDKTFVALNKAAVGLGNVDNTSDADKPISDLTTTALAGKAALVHTHVAADLTIASQRILGRNTSGAGSAEELTATDAKSILGLSNVNNTTDANKPISTATQTALDGKAALVHIHAIADVTGLQSALDGKINTGGIDITDVASLTDELADKLEASDLTTGLATKADLVHTHVAADITDLLDVAAAIVHTHEIDDITGLQSAIDGKANSGDIVTSIKGFIPTLAGNDIVSDVVDKSFTVVLSNSVVKAGIAATAETIVDIKKNGSSIGSATFAIAGSVATLDVPTPADLAFAVGDIIEFEFPAVADSTLARIAFVLRN